MVLISKKLLKLNNQYKRLTTALENIQAKVLARNIQSPSLIFTKLKIEIAEKRTLIQQLLGCVLFTNSSTMHFELASTRNHTSPPQLSLSSIS